jgi:D-arabinono-1,4-lactone oxidase
VAAPPRGEDGFFHPATEAELISLVLMAAGQERHCRVRGSAHSVSHAIYADPLAEIPNRTNRQRPTPGGAVEMMLDRYRGFRVIDEARKIVEVDAGIHLGADPGDPTKTATWATSLLCRLDELGWMVSNLGGITRQTVSGFTATGSSGGSVRYSFNDDILGFRVIDALGNVHVLSRDDPDPARRELFDAMVPNLGLLGVVSTVTLQCVDTYNIAGQESITTVEECAIDLFGPGTAKKPSLEAFLRGVEYGRLLWWPQRGVEKVEVWQAQRIAPQPGFRPHRYEEFTNHPAISEVAVSLIYTVLGNLGDLSRTSKQFERTFRRARQLLEKTAGIRRMGPRGIRLAKWICDTAQRAAECAVLVLRPWAWLIRRAIPRFFPTVLAIFVKLDSERSGDEKGEPQSFHDHAWAGLPMDSEAEDPILPTGFTEMWIPLGRTEQVMRLLRDYFQEPASAREAYERTGLYGWELYAAKATPFWMNAAHEVGDEGEWRDGVFRIDPYWFNANAGDPTETFYPQFWNLLRAHGVPYRLHWGKYQPSYGPHEWSWVNFFADRYPRWGDFVKLRAERDPDGIFLTSYWRDRFGLW